MKTDLILTLCSQCKSIMEIDNVLIQQNNLRQPCDICKHSGFDYKIVKRFKNVRLQRKKVEEKKKSNFKTR